MTSSHLGRYALCPYVIVALLAGCGGSQAPPGPPAVPPQSVARAPAATKTARSSGPLLYVAREVGQGSHSHSVIAIVSLRHDAVVAKITGYGYVGGECSDASGNVWVANLRHHWYVDEFPHGGTKAVDELAAPRRWSSLDGCAVDPSTGDLAVTGANVDGDNKVLIWSGTYTGKPAVYPMPFCPLNAAYDDAGNLFITGDGCGSDFFFEFGELVKGAGSVTQIFLDKPTGTPGAVQWDGTYVTVATNDREGRGPKLYRVQVSGKKGYVVGVVRPRGFAQSSFYHGLLFVLHDDTVIAPSGRSRDRIRAWPYPAGLQPLRSIATFKSIDDITIAK